MKVIIKGLIVMIVTSSLSCSTRSFKQKTIANKVSEFVPIELSVDISELSNKQREMLCILFDVGQIMDDLYWKQAWGDKKALLNSLSDSTLIEFVNINYGPYERLSENKPFIEGVGAKPLGANFYPTDMTLEEFNILTDSSKEGLYSVIERDSIDGALKVIPYNTKYKDQLKYASDLLKQAADLAEDKGFKSYLLKRSEALLSNDYLDSDLAWMSMKDNDIDFIVGPVETYEDALLGAKAAFEAYILLKDKDWSAKLSHFVSLLPELQKKLPVDEKYKTEVPGSDSDLGVYDVIYYGGDCNAGSKTIAINLPNDPRVHLQKGSRKLQLKNTMKAKFDKILKPISELLIDEDQLKHVTFGAFFENAMMHEVAHGLGIKNTLEGSTVRSVLKENATAIEEGKADILGLFLVDILSGQGEFGDEHQIMDNYVTFMAGIFRSVRFGASNSHGKANMIRFNYFKRRNAFEKNPETGKYRVNFPQMHLAMIDLSHDILVIQGDGNYTEAKRMVEEKGIMPPDLLKDLERISNAGIPKDIRFVQGPQVLGL